MRSSFRSRRSTTRPAHSRPVGAPSKPKPHSRAQRIKGRAQDAAPAEAVDVEADAAPAEAGTTRKPDCGRAQRPGPEGWVTGARESGGAWGGGPVGGMGR